MSRELVVANNTPEFLYMREHQYGSVHGYYGHEIRVDPLRVVYDFPAALYCNRNRNRLSLRPSQIIIFVGEGEAVESLSPESFIRFVKLIFELDNWDNLVVYSIRPRWTDLSRFSIFGFLGQEYAGRPRERIIRSHILHNQ